MGEPVEQCAGEALGAEDLGPFVERQIAGHQNRCALVALAVDFKQQFSAGFGQGNEAELVDDEQFVSGELFLKA
jgi:hypothetical protein